MNGDHRFDERITRLLSASHASANPAVLERARARLAARQGATGFLAFLGRPVALASAACLLVASVAVSLVLLRSEGSGATGNATIAATTNTSLVAALLDDDGTYGLPAEVASTSDGASSAAGTSALGDSNGVTP